jgi:hypothetical protein
MTKGEFAKIVLTNEELKSIDYALPQMFVDDCMNLLGINPRPYFVWSYIDDKTTGKPLNLAELYAERFLSINPMNNIIDENERSDNGSQRRDMYEINRERFR